MTDSDSAAREFYWHEPFNNRLWPLPLRWALFMPAGLLSTATVLGLLRVANPGTPFMAEAIARVAESWAFLFPCLWIMPRLNKPFLVVVSIAYFAFHLSFSSLILKGKLHSSQVWADIVLSAIAIASAPVAFVYFMRKVYNLKPIDITYVQDHDYSE